MHLYWAKNASPRQQRKFWPGLPQGVDEKWVVRIKIAPILCEKCKSQIAVKILARASAGGRRKMGRKNQNCTYTVRKLQVLESSENFGQGFRRGRRKMGCKNQKCTCSVRKMQVLDSRGNFGQGFRRGRRKMGCKNQK